MMPWRAIRVSGLLLGVIAALSQVSVSRAQIEQSEPHGADPQVHILRAADYDANTFVPPVVPERGKTWLPSVIINVSYEGFSAQARQAFDYAVSLWEQHLTSPVTVHVSASFQPLEEDVLGSAGPRLTANFSPLAVSDTWYPTSIADAIVAQNVEGGSSDIIASFNSEFDNWYFGLDGQTPAGRYDFVTVVMHELGHGLGFTGSFDVEDTDDEDAECPSGEIGVGCWGLSTSSGRNRYPLIYDRFVEDSQDVPLLNTSAYPNPSLVLGTVLQSGEVFFDGEAVRTIHGDVPVDLYAPETFERGSSFSHLDEQTFPPGDPNSLMTPFLGGSEAVHSPGAVTCAVLNDMGWPIGDACQALFFAGLASAGAVVQGDRVLVSFDVAPGAQIDSVVIEMGRAGQPLDRVQGVDVVAGATQSQQFEVEIADLEPGRYQINLRLVGVDRVITPGPELTVIVPLVDRFRLEQPFPNPAHEDVHLTLMVRDDQPVRVEIYDALGRRQSTVLSANMNRNEEVQLSVDVRDFATGVYFVVVRGEEFSATRQFVRAR